MTHQFGVYRQWLSVRWLMIARSSDPRVIDIGRIECMAHIAGVMSIAMDDFNSNPLNFHSSEVAAILGRVPIMHKCAPMAYALVGSPCCSQDAQPGFLSGLSVTGNGIRHRTEQAAVNECNVLAMPMLVPQY